ncbi:MAG: tRNA dihydrouridine synthase DusB [bacterium]
MWESREIYIGKIRIPNRVFFAPMAGITNIAVRRIAKKYGAGLVYTEMICSQGIVRRNPKTLKLMETSQDERPIALQIFGKEPDIMSEAARIAQENADIIDLNFGCPARTVVNNGSGAAIMRNPSLIKEITSKVVKSVSCPVTAKIRSGWDFKNINAVEIAKVIEDSGAVAVTVHPRLKSQGFSGPPDWQIISEVRNAVSIKVIGNGDIKIPEDGKKMLEMTGCDAIMIGRGALGNPWIFSRVIQYIETGMLLPEPTQSEKINNLLELARALVMLKGELIGCREIRKFIKLYTKGIPNMADTRCRAMHVEKLDELEDLLRPYIENEYNQTFNNDIELPLMI